MEFTLPSFPGGYYKSYRYVFFRHHDLGVQASKGALPGLQDALADTSVNLTWRVGEVLSVFCPRLILKGRTYIYIYIYLSIYLSTYLSIYLSIFLIYLCVCEYYTSIIDTVYIYIDIPLLKATCTTRPKVHPDMLQISQAPDARACLRLHHFQCTALSITGWWSAINEVGPPLQS